MLAIDTQLLVPKIKLQSSSAARNQHNCSPWDFSSCWFHGSQLNQQAWYWRNQQHPTVLQKSTEGHLVLASQHTTLATCVAMTLLCFTQLTERHTKRCLPPLALDPSCGMARPLCLLVRAQLQTLRSSFSCHLFPWAAWFHSKWSLLPLLEASCFHNRKFH